MRKVTLYFGNEPVSSYHSNSIPKVGQWIGSWIVTAVTHDHRTVTVQVRYPTLLD